MLDTIILDTEADLSTREREAYERWREAVRFMEPSSDFLAEYRRIRELRLRLARESVGSRMGR